MVKHEKTKRLPPIPAKEPGRNSSGQSTVPPPRHKRSGPVGSPPVDAPSHASNPQSPPEVTEPYEESLGPIPPPPLVPRTSREARTIAAAQAPSSEPPGDTPPATPIALSSRRSSPNQPNPGPAQPPQPPAQPVAPPPPSQQHIRTGPPGRFDMTQPSAAMRAEFEKRLARETLIRRLFIIGGVVGGLIVVVVFGLVVYVVTTDRSQPVASVVASPSAPLPEAASADTTPPVTAPPPSKRAVACAYRGPTKRLVVGASKDVPLEVWAGPDDDVVSIGFAARNNTGLGFVIDPRTAAPQKSYSKKSNVPIRRVVPFPSGKTISFETNVDDPEASVQNALTVATDPPVRLGTFKSALTIGSASESVPEILWKLPLRGEIESMRATPAPGKGLGLVFRANDALWVGWVDKDRKPVGELSKIPETGLKVGTPSLGYNGREALITFANLDEAKAPWTVRMARTSFGEAPKTSFEWAVPAGGPGGAVIAPNITGLPDGRWIMVWTEGKAGSRAVRVQTYDHEMIAVGEALTVSRPGANAGQGMAVVGKKLGAVFYLSVIGTQYEVWGASIECP